ncbi:response regulator [Paraburkholderia phenoliruptrix]|uniref:Response regulator receiver n=1 Tax=Burkholderia sp. (strain CCGE1003) TaxID=640512 RepID=E1T9N1_BURSG|nr:response regulator [Paraburkholderia phenoliruptrix]MBW9096560.1 response regulator [Paraburkholderia phenoliruptrix]
MLSVLMVESGKGADTSWQAICEMRGYVTFYAADGKAALGFLQGNDIDVVVADRKMADMSGCDLCYHLRKDRRLAELVFILVSDAPSPPAFIYCDAILHKPVAASVLASEIDRIVAERHMNGRQKAARVAGLRY